ncbi:MAG: hypothetical protein RJB32_444, partial [Actinomycetota bacterium]
YLGNMVAQLQTSQTNTNEVIGYITGATANVKED